MSILFLLFVFKVIAAQEPSKADGTLDDTSVKFYVTNPASQLRKDLNLPDKTDMTSRSLNSATDNAANPIYIRYNKVVKKMDSSSNPLNFNSRSNSASVISSNNVIPIKVNTDLISNFNNKEDTQGRQFTFLRRNSPNVLIDGGNQLKMGNQMNKKILGKNQNSVLPEILRSLIQNPNSKNGGTRVLQIDENDSQVNILAFNDPTSASKQTGMENSARMVNSAGMVNPQPVVLDLRTSQQGLQTEQIPLKLLVVEGNPVVLDNKIAGRSVNGAYTVPSKGNLIISAESNLVEEYINPTSEMEKLDDKDSTSSLIIESEE